MTVSWQVIITRHDDDDYVLNYDVWAKREYAPSAVGDGEFVGTYPIGANESTITLTYTTEFAGQYYFMVVPKRGYQIGRESVL